MFYFNFEIKIYKIIKFKIEIDFIRLFLNLKRKFRKILTFK